MRDQIDTNRYPDVIGLPGGITNAISADHIIATGQINHFTPSPMSVDLNRNDSFNAALDIIEDNAMADIMADPEIVAFLKLPEGQRSASDYEAFEHRLNQAISTRMDEITAFDQYRTDGNVVDPAARNLNNLSVDVANGTETMEVDCEAYSIMHSVIAQRIEHQLASNPDYDISASQYYVMTGVVDYSAGNDGGHTYVVSSRTGAIIEATADPDFGAQHSSYLYTVADFNDIINGNNVATYSYESGGAITGFYSAGSTSATYEFNFAAYAPAAQAAFTPDFSAAVQGGLLPVFNIPQDGVGTSGFPVFSNEVKAGIPETSPEDMKAFQDAVQALSGDIPPILSDVVPVDVPQEAGSFDLGNILEDLVSLIQDWIDGNLNLGEVFNRAFDPAIDSGMQIQGELGTGEASLVTQDNERVTDVYQSLVDIAANPQEFTLTSLDRAGAPEVDLPDVNTKSPVMNPVMV